MLVHVSIPLVFCLVDTSTAARSRSKLVALPRSPDRQDDEMSSQKSKARTPGELLRENRMVCVSGLEIDNLANGYD
ncbi:hypothetical protein B0J12DRAFT_342889 [Macrophomina phaseolina]|uniref:Secreted protein n=1 Tax=Macrophomina phaseolina TaxID=35725 RepID=A0ABQ8GM64_9PEZI|nr:hypothetical protein B0J12DRAFT_342889 [Macrophomina phaseolina]